jgi:hypothetical protein
VCQHCRGDRRQLLLLVTRHLLDEWQDRVAAGGEDAVRDFVARGGQVERVAASVSAGSLVDQFVVVETADEVDRAGLAESKGAA